MNWCNRNKIKVEEYICNSCIFQSKKNKKCTYDHWYPGLKKGRNTDIEEIGNA
jgi:hypothetical protein